MQNARLRLCLDLTSLRMLEEAQADFDGTVLVVSHDRWQKLAAR